MKFVHRSFIALVLTVTIHSFARTIHVPKDEPSIQRGIDAASNGAAHRPLLTTMTRSVRKAAPTLGLALEKPERKATSQLIPSLWIQPKRATNSRKVLRPSTQGRTPRRTYPQKTSLVIPGSSGGSLTWEPMSIRESEAPQSQAATLISGLLGRFLSAFPCQR